MFLFGIHFSIIGAWDNVTGMNAPLYGGNDEEKRWNVVSNENERFE